MDHLALLLWHSLLVSVFFAFLWRPTREGRLQLFLKAFLILALGSIALGWLMYWFP